MINTNQEWVTAKDASTSPAEKGYEVTVDLIQPWSVPIMKTTLPPDILQKMIEISDQLLADKESESYGNELVGEINKELYIEPKVLQQAGVMGFFLQIISQFVMMCKCQQYPLNVDEIQQELWMTEIIRTWIISQHPGEYNPIHIHSECKISTVMYLKVPKMLSSRKSYPGLPQLADACITFVGNSSMDVELSTPSITLAPRVGDFYIFGALQQHLVYPFRCEEGQEDTERRSISFNASFQSKTEFDHHTKFVLPVENLIKENKLEEAYEMINSGPISPSTKRRIIANIKRTNHNTALRESVHDLK